jgi:hypothetical protein
MNHIRLRIETLTVLRTLEGVREDRWVPSLDVTFSITPGHGADWKNARSMLSATVRNLHVSHWDKAIRVEVVPDWRYGPRADWEGFVDDDAQGPLAFIARQLEAI